MILDRLTTNLLSLPATTLLLAGCWTPPVATVQPKSPPGLIQKGVIVESVVGPAIVQSVDPPTQMIVLQITGDASAHAYRAGPKVAGGLDRITVGEKVHAIVAEELTIYVSDEGRWPAVDGVPETMTARTKVLSIDPSFRLLTLQYATGRRETFKVGQEVKLEQVQAGDDVAIQPLEVVSISAHKPWWR